MTARVLILGAGFGGLELSSSLSEALGDAVEITLIDKSDSFVFGFSKLDLMFGRVALDTVRIPYGGIVKPGVRFLQQTITSIDPGRRRVTTNDGVHDADYLIIALGADLDIDATPGLAECGNEFYTVAGAARLRSVLPDFSRGHAIVGVCGVPYKCPPAPSEAALLLDEYLTVRGVREQCDITLVLPFGAPVPPSPETSAALAQEFAERRITFVPNRCVTAIDGARGVAVLDAGAPLPCDLFLGIPKHCVPRVVADSGMTENGWAAVNPRTMETKFSRVFAIGDVSDSGAAKAGVYAEDAARVVAGQLIAALGTSESVLPIRSTSSCYIEFGNDRVGRVDMDFISGPKPTSAFQQASAELRVEKEHFGASRRSRWFGA